MKPSVVKAAPPRHRGALGVARRARRPHTQRYHFMVSWPTLAWPGVTKDTTKDLLPRTCGRLMMDDGRNQNAHQVQQCDRWITDHQSIFPQPACYER